MTSQAVNESLEMTGRPVSTTAAPEEADSSESSDTASTGTPKHETAQVDTRSVRDEPLPSNGETKNTIRPQVPTHTEYPFKKHVLYSIITVIAIGIASLVSVCWLIAYIHTSSKNEHPYITVEIVGGRFSSTAAKFIDAAFSMLVAPAIVAVANWHMFKLARLSAVNEHRGRSSAVSMKVLVEVANTDWEVIKYQATLGREESILSKKSLDDANTRYPDIRYPLIAFNQTAIWIGSINVNQSSGISPIDGSYRLVLSGMNCHLEKSNGHADIKVNESQWTTIKDTLFNEHHDLRPSEPASSLTSTLEIVDDSHVRRAPGLGGHLLRAALNTTSEGDQPSWKLQSLFEAFLWYEIASRHALLDSISFKKTGWYKIQCDADKYAMTLIPWILLIVLIALGVACAITVGLLIDSRKLHSLRIGRMLDSVRLIADVRVALDKQALEECSTWYGSRLNKCADGASFQYETDSWLDSNTGLYSIGIRLRQISRPHE
ncbi:unnamed protein product [Fusarium venenatum]|uniref:Uncharacterized protein n=2 Tax=Fusarium venenatum TaxID=56646 RepID=A0A2L2TGL9_9HYPO|nr:uncharacterized protein FVRRES_09325 [Fusarium venenatum]CEI69248.1 unnamed protein product [Fusarium venenatum]